MGGMSTATVAVDGVPGVTIAYERRGCGDPLVLLHGIGHHRQAWEPVLGKLTAERDVIWLDLPGFGQSGPIPPDARHDLDSLAGGIAAFCAEIGVDQPHIAGNSLGGLIGLRLGQLGLVRSVTALSPAGLWTAREREWTLKVLRSMRIAARRTPPRVVERLSRSTAGRRVVTGIIYHRPARRDPAAVVAETAALRNATGFEGVLETGRAGFVFDGDVPDIPVIVAWGTHDRILPPRQAEQARRQFPAARIVSLPACGHVPMNDDPDLVAQVILAGTSPR
jgi:pimeloyl-ACP methyl ester carboxylesterase